MQLARQARFHGRLRVLLVSIQSMGRSIQNCKLACLTRDTEHGAAAAGESYKSNQQ